MRKNRVPGKTSDIKKYKTERNKKIGHFRPKYLIRCQHRPKSAFFDHFFGLNFAKTAKFLSILNLCQKVELPVKLGC